MKELMLLMSQNSWLFLCVVFIFSATIGSFLNVVIHRLPVMMKREWQQECNAFLEEYHPNVLKKIKREMDTPIDHYPKRYNLIVPGSRCPSCGSRIRAIHNIPIIGWMLLRGKCADCSADISTRYPLVEFVTGISIAILAWHFGPSGEFIASATLAFCLIVLAAIDLDEMLLPDNITFPLIWLGLIINYNAVFVSLEDALIGAIAGYFSLWSVYWMFKLATGKEGMGYGDFKLMALLGAWFGWQALPFIILFSSVTGAVIGIISIINKKSERDTPIPFGPFIAFSGYIFMIVMDEKILKITGLIL